ncbi:MAG: hypothetical protein WBV95_20645 [Desulfobacterales bacterium]
MMEQEATLIRARLKAPRAGAIAGIVFSILFIILRISSSTLRWNWETPSRSRTQSNSKNDAAGTMFFDCRAVYQLEERRIIAGIN